MILRSVSSHKYSSAHKRFLIPTIERFFEQQLPRSFGPIIRTSIAEKLVELFESLNVETSCIKPGQLLWHAVHKDTRADSKNVKFKPIILTIVHQDDIFQLERGINTFQHKKLVLERITSEAYEQGALLSMRDISLFWAANPTSVSAARIKAEKENGKVMLHTGNLHDMGSCITHKYQIIYKYVVEKKDPNTIAAETAHTIKAVDHYLSCYNRVRMLWDDGKDIPFISVASGISEYVVKQYVSIIKQYVYKTEPLKKGEN